MRPALCEECQVLDFGIIQAVDHVIWEDTCAVPPLPHRCSDNRKTDEVTLKTCHVTCWKTAVCFRRWIELRWCVCSQACLCTLHTYTHSTHILYHLYLFCFCSVHNDYWNFYIWIQIKSISFSVITVFVIWVKHLKVHLNGVRLTSNVFIWDKKCNILRFF